MLLLCCCTSCLDQQLYAGKCPSCSESLIVTVAQVIRQPDYVGTAYECKGSLHHAVASSVRLHLVTSLSGCLQLAPAPIPLWCARKKPASLLSTSLACAPGRCISTLASSYIIATNASSSGNGQRSALKRSVQQYHAPHGSSCCFTVPVLSFYSLADYRMTHCDGCGSHYFRGHSGFSCDRCEKDSGNE
jgi:hypothetical protein